MSTLRITGMASGLDTENMVKQMMQPYNIKLDKMKQNKQIIQWKQDLFRDIIKDVMDLRDTFMNTLKPETNMLSSNSYVNFDTKIASGGENKLTLSTSSAAIEGQYTISISSLATKARIEGSKLKQGDVQATLATKINELDSNATLPDSKTLSIKYGIDDAIPIVIDANSTISSVISDINKNLNGKVNARFSELTGSIIIESVATGENESIVLSGDNSIKALGITTTSDEGENASVTVTPPNDSDGIGVTVSRATNSFTIDGISYNLLAKGETSFTVNSSEQKTFDNIVKFIDKYNALVEKLNVKLSEKREYSYSPLTDEQKKDMKEDEIKSWEEKAKTGLLSGDITLEKLKSSMRQAFFAPIAGSSLNFGKNDIGLDTAVRYKDAGKIVISDEAKLKEVIRNNPQEIMNLFTKTPAADSGDSYSDSGIITRISDVIKNNIGMVGKAKGELIDKAGYVGTSSDSTNILTKQINDHEKRIREFQSTLLAKENRFYKQFASLETYMNKMNSQSSWLSQQLGGMG
jgi:flagellar hook-associated protein 2